MFVHLPTFLKNTKHADPRDQAHGPFHAAHDSPLGFFPWLEAHPPLGPSFASAMRGFRAAERTWLDPGGYPIEERLAAAGADEVLLVDVGGGLGHDCEAVRAKHPALKGRLVLQDRPEVVARVPKEKGELFEAMELDFFTPQPVVGMQPHFTGPNHL